MKKIISSLVLIIASVTSQAACADSYWGLGYSNYEMNVNVSDDWSNTINMKADLNAIEGVFGVNVSANVAWEVRAGFGLNEDSVVFSYRGESGTLGVTDKLNSYFSGYFKPQIAQDNFNIYGLLGFSTVSTTLDGSSIGVPKEDTTDSGFSYGIGAGLTISESNSLVIEWKNLSKIDGGDIKGLTLGFRRSF